MTKPEFKASRQLLSFFNSFFEAAWPKHGHVIILCALKLNKEILRINLVYSHYFRGKRNKDTIMQKEVITNSIYTGCCLKSGLFLIMS